MIEHHEGKGGAWGVAHDGGLVLLKFERTGDALGIFQAALTPAIAIDLAQSLIKHALQAGHDGPVQINIGGH